MLLDARKNDIIMPAIVLESRECVDGPKALSPRLYLSAYANGTDFYFVGDAVLATQNI